MQTTTAITEQIMTAWPSGKAKRTLVQQGSTATSPARIDLMRLT